MSSSLSRFENARKRQLISNRKKANWFLAESSPGNDSSVTSNGDSTLPLDRSTEALDDSTKTSPAQAPVVEISPTVEKTTPQQPVEADVSVVKEIKGESSTSDSCSSPQQQSPQLQSSSVTSPNEPKQSFGYNFLVENFYGSASLKVKTTATS